MEHVSVNLRVRAFELSLASLKITFSCRNFLCSCLTGISGSSAGKRKQNQTRKQRNKEMGGKQDEKK